MLPPMVMATAQNAVVFMTHTFMLRHVVNSNPVHGNESYQDLFISGAASGFVSAIIQCPTELIKIKLQLYSSKVRYVCVYDIFMYSPV